MAADIGVNIQLNDGDAKAKLEKFKDVLDRILEKKKLQIEIDDAKLKVAESRAKMAASSIAKLTSSAALYDAQLKESEAAAKRFSAALKAQMEAEQEEANARKGLVSEMNAWDQAIHANEVASKEFANALRQQMLAQREEEQEAKKAAAAEKEEAKAAREAGNETKAAGDAAQTASSGFSTLNVALGNIAARAFHLVLSKITQGIREAITEMKNVDTQLINISKVSGKTGEDLTQIGDAAYDTASKYGVAASEYLESVYKMQKAGMGDQSENMGELAVKTMLVGDTTEEIASKFLIAANAAWKLDGNMERLGQIVDEADYINNNYATSLDKLAAGMPIVASVAENAGMSAEETIAALGTITAATQESGTKAATALRALILNIEGQVGSYITEEGEQIDVTAESVDKMKTLLEKYASAELDAAKAAGELLNPMDAIRALFKGMANDDLNDIQMFDLLSSFGGKLRTNQLTALVKNYETLYTDMMSHMEDAAGTADKEIDLMMQSWEKKTQVLKDKWTELISDIVDTDAAKGFIDDLTTVIGQIDSLVEKNNKPFYESETTNKEIDSTQQKIDDLKKSIEDLSKSPTPDFSRIRDLELELQLQEKILKAKQEQYKLEHQEEVKKLQGKLTQTYYDAMGRPMQGPVTSADTEALYNINHAIEGIEFDLDLNAFQSNLKDIVASSAEYYENVKKVQEADLPITEAQKQFIDNYEQIKKLSEAEGIHLGNLNDGYWEIVDSSGEVLANVRDITPEIEQQTAETEHQLGYSEEYVSEMLNKWQEYQDAKAEYDAADEAQQSQMFSSLKEKWDEFRASWDDASQEEKDAFLESKKSADDTADATGGISEGIEEATASANLLTAALNAASLAAASIKINPGGIDMEAEGTKNAPGGPTLVNELGPELISENGHAYIANGGRPGIVNLSRGAIVLTAEETRNAVRGTKRISTIHAAATGAPITIGGGTGPSSNRAADDQRKRAAAIAAAQAYNAALIAANKKTVSSELKPEDTISATFKGKGGAGGAPAGKSAAELLKEAADSTKDALSNIEKQAKLADNRGQYDKEAKLWAKGQAEIDKMIAQYKKAGYKETDDEILDLLNKRYEYEKKKDAASKKTIENAAKEVKEKLSVLDKQAKLANGEGNYVDEVKYYEQAQEEIAKMVEMYRKAGYADDSKEILELLQKNVDYGEKQVKVYQDRFKDLINALEEDTDAQEAANKLAEKEQALAEARDALANANKKFYVV